jgi:hypothetical protein
VVREIAERWIKSATDENQFIHRPWVEGVAREAIEHGRALGARDERERCARLASEYANEAEQKTGYYDASAAACDAIADAIERDTP